MDREFLLARNLCLQRKWWLLSLFDKKLYQTKKKGNVKSFCVCELAAIPETLIESELFGYEKGSFTGATEVKKGKFELANKGTLLLDKNW